MAQESIADSLTSLIDTEKDTTKRMEYLYALSNYYIDNATDKCFLVAHELLVLSEKKIDTTYQFKAINLLGQAHYFSGNTNKALEFFLALQKIAEDSDNDEYRRKAYNSVGIVYNKLGRTTDALAVYNKSLRINRKLGNKKGERNALNNIGIVYQERLKDYEKALDYYKKSYHIELELSDYDGISTSQLNIGDLYRLMGVYDSALFYCGLSINISDSLNFILTKEYNYESIYRTYKSKNVVDSALHYHELYLDIRQQRINEESQKVYWSEFGFRIKLIYFQTFETSGQ